MSAYGVGGKRLHKENVIDTLVRKYFGWIVRPQIRGFEKQSK
jgi:hypothetical protein